MNGQENSVYFLAAALLPSQGKGAQLRRKPGFNSRAHSKSAAQPRTQKTPQTQPEPPSNEASRQPADTDENEYNSLPAKNIYQWQFMCMMNVVAGHHYVRTRPLLLMKNILLIAAAVLPLVLNSCRYIGETEPFYADGHRRGTYYGAKDEIPPLFGRHHTTGVYVNGQSTTYITRDHMMWSTYPNYGRNGAR
jgi:hypothetical protein